MWVNGKGEALYLTIVQDTYLLSMLSRNVLPDITPAKGFSYASSAGASSCVQVKHQDMQQPSDGEVQLG